jgi:hypothetical protein
METINQNSKTDTLSDKDSVSSSATIFEVELFRFINKHVKEGLSKPDLIAKMKYVLKSCEMS